MHSFNGIVILSLACAYANASIGRVNLDLPEPHLTIMGSFGVGKSTLANVLLGEPYDCDDCTFPICNGTGSCTKETTFAMGKWVGEGSTFSVVDTPGYGDPQNDDNELLDEMVDVLKENISTTDGFLLMFKGDDESFDEHIKQTLREFQLIFGREFWNFTTIGVSFWHYDESSIRYRNESGRDEFWFCSEKNKGIKEQFDVTTDLPCVFIDSYANKDDENESKAFVRETNKLWEIINASEPFNYVSIQDSLEEEKEEVHRLQDIIDEEIAELQEAVAKVQDETEGNSISIVDVKRITDENRNSIMNVNRTLDNSVEEFSKSLNETTDELNQSLDETEKRLSGELASEKTARDKSEQQIRDDISGVDDRVDNLENAATMKCSYD